MKEVMCHDNFQLAQVKMRRQRSIFIYDRIQIEKMFVELEANLKDPQNLNDKNIYSKTYILNDTYQTLI